MKLCVIYNTAPRYREAIFRAIDQEYDCDWFFGPTTTDIKEMDTTCLNHVSYYKTWGDINKLYYKRSILKLLFKKKYQHFLMLAESRSITDYIFFFLAHTFFKKKKIYIWTHGWYGKETSLEARLKRWMFNHVTGLFVYGNYSKQLLIKEGIPENKIFVIHNSLHYDTQIDLRNKIKPSDIYIKHFGNNNPVLIFIGRLTKVKKLNQLLNAISLLKNKKENYNVVFVGDGERRQSLEQLVLDLGLNNEVWFYGSCYNEKENAELIYNADLCVAPGNVGLTAMHTMVFGCPVISHNDFKWQMPEFEAIQPGITGDFFIRDDVSSLANTISNWFYKFSNKRAEVRKACFSEIDCSWNPYFQIQVIKKYLE